MLVMSLQLYATSDKLFDERIKQDIVQSTPRDAPDPALERGFRLIEVQEADEFVSPLEPKVIENDDAVNSKQQKNTTSPNMNQKLAKSREILRRLKLAVDVEFTLAILGILFMLIDNELFVNYSWYSKSHTASISLKCVVTITTFMLLMVINYYYILILRLRMVSNSLENYADAISIDVVIQLLIELIICSIHPVPVTDRVLMEVESSGGMLTHVDGILNILMCFRLYIVIRFLAVNTSMYSDTSLRSLCSVNGINYNTNFIVKAYFSRFPGLVLGVTVVVVLVILSWSMRTCEYFYTSPLKKEVNTFHDSLWLVSITFLTVGYGDITAKSQCGRFISIITGFLGVCTTALVIATISKYMEQSKSEKLISQFGDRGRIEKKKKKTAASVIRSALRLWIQKRRNQKSTIYKSNHRLRKDVSKMQELRQNKMVLDQDAAELYGETAAMLELKMAVDRTRSDIQKLQDSLNELLQRNSSVIIRK